MKRLNSSLPAKSTQPNKILFAVSILLVVVSANAQSVVSGIVTDYNGFWKSSASSVNNTKPANSHNLLSFTYNNIQYSTGANDQALTSHGENFIAGDFWSLPLANLSAAITSNTKVGVGEMYDGVHNGASNPAPSNNMSFYLTDGVKGLNLGTGIANLPAGTMSFNVSAIQPQNIGDGIPDILVTQIADPSGSTDGYSFVTANGTVVGTRKDMVFTSITPVGKWTADFYEASASPMNLTGGFTNTDRDIRLWAADLSDFGITAANYQSISKFMINLSGNSDVAFVAYNNMTFTFQTILPVKLSDFSAKASNAVSQLKWETETETNTNRFVIESSTNNTDFSEIGTVRANGNSVSTINYSFIDKNPSNGVNYYRLKMVDADGSFEFSKIMQVKFSLATATVGLYPNPCTNSLAVHHPVATGAQITVYNAGGIVVLKTNTASNSTQTNINTQNLQTGLYYTVWQSGNEKISLPVIKK